MKKVATKDLIPNMVISREVLSGDGLVLLEKGARLSESQIANLRKWLIPYIYIADDQLEATCGQSTAIFLGEYVRTIDAVRHAFEHIRLFREVPVLEMEELAAERITFLSETLGVLDHLYEIKMRSDDTFQHSLNVAIIAAIFGRWQKYRGAELKNLILSALLHDIGKLFVPLTVLDKPGTLSSGEFAVMKGHPFEGYRLVADSAQLDDSVKLGILQHHERLDGSGYPAALKGDDITDYARIIAVADIYDAMTSQSMFRSPMTPFAVIAEVCGEMFARLDPTVALPFVNNVRDSMIGYMVRLSDGTEARVVYLDKERFAQPVVKLSDGGYVDLEKRRDLKIVEVIAS